jgi:hypothetical protein
MEEDLDLDDEVGGDEVVRVAREMTTNTSGEWSLLTPADFEQDSNSDKVSCSESFCLWLRSKLQTIDPNIRVKKKNEYPKYMRYQCYCSCSGTYISNEAVDRHRESKKVGCRFSFMLKVSRSGVLETTVEECNLLHSGHENTYKSRIHTDSRVPVEDVYPKANLIQELLERLDLSETPPFRQFLATVQMSLFGGKRLDKKSVLYLKHGYVRRINKDFRPATTLEMIQELHSNQEKYYCMPLKAEYDANKVTC